MVRGDEEKAPFLSEEAQIREPIRGWSTTILVSCLIVSVVVNCFAGVAYMTRNLDHICSRYTQQYKSPIMDSMTIEYKTVTYNGTFSHDGIYRQAPSVEVDKAWQDPGTDNQHYVIPEDRAEEYGLDPRHTKIIPEQGGGFPVLFEFKHHLHCLDLVRRSTWFNAPYYFANSANTSFAAGETTMKKHANHCIDMIRQVIMCRPDTGVFGQYWVKEIDGPFVDFDTKHKCKNFWAIKDWVTHHQKISDQELKVRYREGDILLDTIP